MKIEVGKFYKTRDGRKVGPMGEWKREKFDCEIDGFHGDFWTKDGLFALSRGDEPKDLIAEWTDTPEVGTLQEIGAGEGDTIIYVGDDATPTNKSRVYRGTVDDNHYADDQKWGGSISLNETGPWRIISRAQPKPEQTGPVRTVTRTTREIVPGVYGPLTIRATDEGGPVQIEINGTTGRTWFNKDDIDALVVHLTAIRDALKENGE